MNEVNTFVQEARKKKLDDNAIRQALEEKGWEKPTIDLALAGLEAPSPGEKEPHTAPPSAGIESKPESSTAQKPTLSPLLAALHHVILWFFTGSSMVTIGGTIATLYGSNLDSRTLASMIAVTLITFVPYAILFAIFLKKTRKNPSFIPGRVWSIITICLHSIGAMVAAIVAVITVITDGDIRVLVSALVILGLDLLIVSVYSLAAFTDNKHTIRKIVLTAHLPLLVILFGTLFTLCVLKIGPLKHDEQLREAMASTARNVAKYAEQNNKLPENASQIEVKPGVEYHKQSNTTYELCGTFQATIAPEHDYDFYSRSTSSTPTDDYVYESMFSATSSGKQCTEIKSNALREQPGQSDPGSANLQSSRATP